jgi:hypothetical protein
VGDPGDLPVPEVGTTDHGVVVVYKIPIWLSLAVIATTLVVAVVAGLRATRDRGRPDVPTLTTGR